jgi:hypothetical protein
MQGDQGIQGLQGEPGVSGRELVTNQESDVTVNMGESHFTRAFCPAGKKVIGGGCNTESGFFIPIRSAPSSESQNPQFWECRFYNFAPYGIGNLNFAAHAICATTLP